MNIIDVGNQETNWLTCGDAQAASFLVEWRQYVHDIDDIIDKDEKVDNEFIISTFMKAAFIYSHPFYLANITSLKQIVINCTNAYADSVAWENSNIPYKKEFSDHYRHFGVEMALAIAGICGGYLHMRSVSLILRDLCYKEHHDEKGNII